MPLNDVYQQFETAADEAYTWLASEVGTLRTSRVTPALVENVSVEHYGTRTPLNGVASVTNTDARTLQISPWDQSAVTAIEKALIEADVGATPSVDGAHIRLAFPSLTEEVREQTIKLLHQKAEEARVRLRQARDEGLSTVKKGKQSDEYTEDDMHAAKKELDQRISKHNESVEALVSKKEEDIGTL